MLYKISTQTAPLQINIKEAYKIFSQDKCWTNAAVGVALARALKNKTPYVVIPCVTYARGRVTKVWFSIIKASKPMPKHADFDADSYLASPNGKTYHIDLRR